MKPVPHQNQDADLPPGYEHVRVGAGALLLLPKSAADVLRQRQREREEEERKRQRQELMREREEEKAEAQKRQPKKAEPERAAYGPEPERGWYRVLPKLEVQVEPDASVGWSTDRDVNERRVRIHKQLRKLGPDRRVATVPNWREALTELEASLPHFRDPIRLLRNALALADGTGVAARVPPMLLLGPPGVGKTHFSHRVAQLFGAPHGSVQFDQPSAGGQLRGSDKYWANSEPGLLFNLVCLGAYANPVVLLDELDKSAGGGLRDVEPLAQLHGALEPETARRLTDSSVEVEFDASLVTYIGTANTARGIGGPILSRMEVFEIEPPDRDASYAIAQAIVGQALRRFTLEGRVDFERRAVCLLAHLSPRLMTRAVEQAAAAAVADGRGRVSEDEVWAVLRVGGGEPRLH
jgi:ATP-dependent Lon protease